MSCIALCILLWVSDCHDQNPTKRCVRRCFTTGLCCTPSDAINSILTDTCPTPQDTGNFQIESIPPTLTVGLFVEYKCIAEHAVQSGNLLRGCTIDGTLSGSPPVCVRKYPTSLVWLGGRKTVFGIY